MNKEINFIKHSINVKNFCGAFKISKEILNILDISQDLVLWKKSDNEIIIFTEDSWLWFVNKIKDKKWLSDMKINYTKKWNEFIRGLYSLATPVNLRKNNELFLLWNSRIKKILEWKELDISFCF